MQILSNQKKQTDVIQNLQLSRFWQKIPHKLAEYGEYGNIVRTGVKLKAQNPFKLE